MPRFRTPRIFARIATSIMVTARFRAYLVLAVSVGVATVSCSPIADPDGSLIPRVELQLRWSQWQSNGPRAYAYTLRTSCFCPPPSGRPLRIDVRDGRVVHVHDVATGDVIPPTGFPSIDTLFVRAIAATKEHNLIEIEFDPRLGYPTVINTGEPRIADSGVRYEVSDLTAAP